MTKNVLAIAATLMVAMQAAHADYTINELEAKHRAPDARVLMDFYLQGVGEGVLYGQAAYKFKQQAPRLYCMPDELALDGAAYFDILEDYLAHEPTKRVLLNKSASAALIFALEYTFPCPLR